MEDTVAQTVRVRFDIAYDGTGFHGWACQPGLRTVQGVLETALETILREPVTLTVAGRTDAGVHARGQVAHADLSAQAVASLRDRAGRCPGTVLRTRLAGVLSREYRAAMAAARSSTSGTAANTAGANNAAAPAGTGAAVRLNVPRGVSDVVVRQVRKVPADFDARFSALAREYTYRVCTGPADPLRRHDVLWWGEEPLDVAAMNAAARGLLGTHDFLSYCKPREGATTIRTLQRLDVVELGGGAGQQLLIHARADAFCHSMVRTLVGALLRVGSGARDIEWPRRRLAECNRTGEVVVAPAHPLTLENVIYPEPEGYAQRAQQARQRRDECC